MLHDLPKEFDVFVPVKIFVDRDASGCQNRQQIPVLIDRCTWSCLQGHEVLNFGKHKGKDFALVNIRYPSYYRYLPAAMHTLALSEELQAERYITFCKEAHYG